MPTSNKGGISPAWTRLVADIGLGGTVGLVSAIIDTARNWVNSLQAIAPGYRDRIVHISLSKTEGGLNLTMPPDVLDNLNEYGQEAGQRLIDHFINGTDPNVNGADPSDHTTEMTWNNQRWIRYRSTMALLEDFLEKFADTINHPEPGDLSYLELITNSPSYHFNPDRKLAAEKKTQSLIGLSPEMSLGEGSPTPSQSSSFARHFSFPLWPYSTGVFRLLERPACSFESQPGPYRAAPRGSS